MGNWVGHQHSRHHQSIELIRSGNSSLCSTHPAKIRLKSENKEGTALREKSSMLFIDTVIKRSVCYRTVWSALTELKTPHQKNLQDTDHKLKPADVKSAKRA